MSMQQTKVINVPFTADNVKKCRCAVCPVQKNSQCVKDKVNKAEDSLKANPLNPQDFPNVYCSQGNASCQDIDAGQPCICSTCLVFSGYNLANAQITGYYCVQGKAR